MMAMRGLAFVLCAAAIAAATPARAQTYIRTDAPRGGSIELTGGASISPGFDLDSAQAELTRGAQSDGLDLFRTQGEVSGFPGIYARVGVYVSRAISVEGGLRFAKPELRYRLSQDFEQAAEETATDSTTHYVFDGSVLFHFTGASFGGGRGMPFVSAGGGYIRELHEGNELVETGNEFHATAGIKYWFGSGRQRFGLRGEFGVSSRQKGFETTEDRRTLPIALGGIAYLF
jgi:hypothetical protein